MTPINFDNVAAFIEIRGLYDGWSIARMKDGGYVNRWPEGDHRHARAQAAIDAVKDRGAGDGRG